VGESVDLQCVQCPLSTSWRDDFLFLLNIKKKYIFILTKGANGRKILTWCGECASGHRVTPDGSTDGHAKKDRSDCTGVAR